MRVGRRSGGCPRAALVLLAVLIFDIFHHGLGDNDSLRKASSKRSRQGQPVNLLDSHHRLQRTKRSWIMSTLELEEEDKGPFPKLIGEVFNNKSYDTTIKYLISGPGVDKYPEAGLFSLGDDSRGLVYVHRSIDRETNPSFLVRFDVASTATGEIVDRPLFFTVKIEDTNDNAPKFTQKEFDVTVEENHRRDKPIFRVTASDDDEPDSENSRVGYYLVLQTPRTKEPNFTVESCSGLIRMAGCSHYEGPRAFKLLIKATDHGIPPLSSTATINIAIKDSNTHLPEFTKENYRLNITENQTEGDILHLSVEDKDTRNTPGWRAKYKIVKGNERGNFIIKTDPNTNEGVLSIIKPLVYDGTPGKSLIISVENEEPFFSCDRGQMRSLREPPKTTNVNIIVLNVNDAPQFHPPVLVVQREEGVKRGTYLGQYTARDPDRVPNAIRYQIVFDPAGWVAVEEHSGILTTVEILDRESPYVNNSTYTIIIHAVDDGVPPQTGTGTIQLFLFDINDNAPKLVTPSLDICVGMEKGSFPIKAEDKDDFPFAGPFTFQLAESSENTKGVWKLGRTFGDSAELQMLRNLPIGNYSVPLHILDKQAFSRIQSLYVRVCSCLGGNICDSVPQYQLSVIGGGEVAGILAVILSFLLGFCLLLWRFYHSHAPFKNYFPLVSWKIRRQSLMPSSEESQQTPTESQQTLSQDMPGVRNPISPPIFGKNPSESSQTHEDMSDVGNPIPPTGNIPRKIPENHKEKTPKSSLNSWTFSDVYFEYILPRLHHIAYLEDDMMDSYPPHVYAEEGSLGDDASVWSLPFAEDLPPGFMDTLGAEFTTLSKIISK